MSTVATKLWDTLLIAFVDDDDPKVVHLSFEVTGESELDDYTERFTAQWDGETITDPDIRLTREPECQDLDAALGCLSKQLRELTDGPVSP